MPTYTQSGQLGADPGQPCTHCGLPGHAHDKERVSTPRGFSYDYVCPPEAL